MKAFYIVSFLLVSIIFVPSSITARELSQKEEKRALVADGLVTKCTRNPNKSCLPAIPKKKCNDPYNRNCHP
ncbi:hypothetical protein I3760_03G189200 [Carya illinoinensis]|uniref:Uncharacterized protein n=1 Tax=Carya illinoinensis TaxID=32201 RepID=A0A8T1R4A6_CARIL|nr:hypothetical protein I3760_Q014600 [Carya illinoinensis]KAG2717716.1 hypothetical protein I3760_03G189200 [Carya illinoinensis]KAG6661746.1 hypothetical protein CIPAW_03G196600 [Carya illinoinensis]